MKKILGLGIILLSITYSFATIGSIKANEIEGRYYADGTNSSLAVLSNGNLVSAYEKDGKLNLQFFDIFGEKIKEINDYDEGYKPNIAILPDDSIIEVHESGHNKGLMFDHIDSETGKQLKNIKYDNGKAPSITTLSDGTIIEVHQAREAADSDLWLDVLNVEGDLLFNTKYESGNRPSIVGGSGGTIFEVHDNSSPDHIDLWFDKLVLSRTPDAGYSIERKVNKQFAKGWSAKIIMQANERVPGSLVTTYEIDSQTKKGLWRTTLNDKGKDVGGCNYSSSGRRPSIVQLSDSTFGASYQKDNKLYYRKFV